MHKTFTLAAVALVVVASHARAQTLLFETTLGDFEMVLNTTNNPDLQAHVDNIVTYAALGRYNNTVINRARDNFVLQMGSLTAFPGSLDLPTQLFPSLETFDPVIVTDDSGQIAIDVDGEDTDGDGFDAGDDDDLTNTFRTVSLALGNFPGSNVTNPDSGTSSFFINLDDNSFLDASGFIPFARIRDFETINAIMDLEKQNFSNFVGQPGSSAFTDIPVTEDGDFVVINNVEIIERPADFSLADAIVRGLGIEIPDAPTGSVGTPEAGSAVGVPEPTSLALAACGLACLGRGAARRRRLSRKG